ncbi:MAG: hypothetical protein AAGF84_08100 [Planctomycetota bacterium]
MKRAAFACLGLLFAAPIAHAQPEPVPVEAAPPVVIETNQTAALLADLDADDWAIRQRATDALLTEPSATPRRLADALNAPDVSTEAQQRLRLVLRHRILAEFLANFPAPPGIPPDAEAPDALGPPQAREAAAAWQALVDTAMAEEAARRNAGSLGIMHPPTPVDAVPSREGPEIMVVDTLPGFPAYEVLRPGDAIIRFNNQPIPAAPNNANLPAPVNNLIQRRHAGDTIPLRVLRDGQEIDLTITLASYAALRTLYTNQAGMATRLSDPVQAALDRRIAALLAN